VRLVLAVGLALLGAAPSGAQQDERWQVRLNNDAILWELRLVRLQHDTLVLRHGDSTYRFPIGAVDELRLVRKSERRQTAEPNRYGGVLAGSDDEIYRLTLYDVSERRHVLEQIFKDHPPPASP
jgi:hypothetical protein